MNKVFRSHLWRFKTTILRNKYIFYYKQHTENDILCTFRYIVFTATSNHISIIL